MLVVNMRKERTVRFFKYSSFFISFIYHFRKLNDAFPLKKLGHLKRVRCVKTEKGGILKYIILRKARINYLVYFVPDKIDRWVFT